MQWKQLLVLFLGCIAGPLETHTQLFIAFLTALTAQLQLGLGVNGPGTTACSGAAAGDSSDTGGDAGAALLAGGLVDELLPDSFLKTAFKGFFEVLQESGDTAPTGLLAQVGFGWIELLLKCSYA